MADKQAIKSTAAKLSQILQPASTASNASPKAIKVLSNQNLIRNTEVTDEITQISDNLTSTSKSVTAAGDSMKMVDFKSKAKASFGKSKKPKSTSKSSKGSAKTVPIESLSKPRSGVYELSSAVKIVAGTPCSAAGRSTLNVSPTVHSIIPPISPAGDCSVKPSSIRATAASYSSPTSIFDPEDLNGESLPLIDPACTVKVKSLPGEKLKPQTKKAKISKRSIAEQPESSHNPKTSGTGTEVSCSPTHGTYTASIAGKMSQYIF